MLTKVEGTIKATVESRFLLMSKAKTHHRDPLRERATMWVCNVSITQLPDHKADHVLLPLHVLPAPQGATSKLLLVSSNKVRRRVKTNSTLPHGGLLSLGWRTDVLNLIKVHSFNNFITWLDLTISDSDWNDLWTCFRFYPGLGEWVADNNPRELERGKHKAALCSSPRKSSLFNKTEGGVT